MNVKPVLFAVSCLTFTIVARIAFAAAPVVTVWIPSEVRIDAATARVATIARGNGQAKFSKACAKAPGKFDIYSATIFDPGLGTTHIVEIATEKLPGKGLSMDLSSLRADGECTEGKQKWRRFTAVLTEPAPSKANDAKEKPKPDEKKKDN